MYAIPKLILITSTQSASIGFHYTNFLRKVAQQIKYKTNSQLNRMKSGKGKGSGSERLTCI